MQDDPVVERMLQLLTKQKKTQKDLSDYLGLSTAVFPQWRRGLSTSYKKYAKQIAEFFDVSPSYLLEGIDSEMENLTPDEIEIINIYRSLKDKEKEYVQQTLHYVKNI